MTKKGDDESPAESFASPPCSMHEVDPAYMGLENEKNRSGSPGEQEVARLKEVLLHELPDAVIYADKDGNIRFWT